MMEENTLVPIAIAMIIIVMLILYLTSPRLHVVHGARVKPLPWLYRRDPLAGFIEDETGKPISLSDSMLGITYGSSGEAFGLPDGSRFIAKCLDDQERMNLKKGDIVVINAPTRASKTGRRLRKVKAIDTKTSLITFEDDIQNNQFSQRQLTHVEAKVTHIPIVFFSYKMKRI